MIITSNRTRKLYLEYDTQGFILTEVKLYNSQSSPRNGYGISSTIRFTAKEWTVILAAIELKGLFLCDETKDRAKSKSKRISRLRKGKN